MLTGEEGIGGAARSGDSITGARREAPAIRRKSRRLWHGPMAVLLRNWRGVIRPDATVADAIKLRNYGAAPRLHPVLPIRLLDRALPARVQGEPTSAVRLLGLPVVYGRRRMAPV